MRIAAHLLLFLFVAFLATPTIVCAIRKSIDTSHYYSLAEEELSHSQLKEIKETLDLEFKLIFHTFFKNLFFLGNLLKHDSITAKIFSPPPNL